MGAGRSWADSSVLLCSGRRAHNGGAGEKNTIRALQILDIERLGSAQFAIYEIQVDAAVTDPFARVGVVGTVPVLHAAGGELVASIRGCYLNIVGLPVMLLCRMLGVETPYECPCANHDLQTCPSGCGLGGC